MDLTDGDGNERAALQSSLLPDRVYVMDRGYAKFELFADILNVRSSFVCRVRDNSVYATLQPNAMNGSAPVAETSSKHGENQHVAWQPVEKGGAYVGPAFQPVSSAKQRHGPAGKPVPQANECHLTL